MRIDNNFDNHDIFYTNRVYYNYYVYNLFLNINVSYLIYFVFNVRLNNMTHIYQTCHLLELLTYTY